MKRRYIPFALLISSLCFTSCSQKTSINAEQAIQILDMIIYERYLTGDPRTFEECSFHFSMTINGVDKPLCYYELSKVNNIVHVYNDSEGVDETWYYVNSGILYEAKRNGEEINTKIIESDPEKALSTFNVSYFALASDNAEKRINDIDKPTKTKEKLIDYRPINDLNLSQKFSTKKNYHVSGDVKVYNDQFHKEFLSSYAFEYQDKYLKTLDYQEEGHDVIYHYSISYSPKLSIDLIK